MNGGFVSRYKKLALMSAEELQARAIQRTRRRQHIMRNLPKSACHMRRYELDSFDDHYATILCPVCRQRRKMEIEGP